MSRKPPCRTSSGALTPNGPQWTNGQRWGPRPPLNPAKPDTPWPVRGHSDTCPGERACARVASDSEYLDAEHRELYPEHREE